MKCDTAPRLFKIQLIVALALAAVTGLGAGWATSWEAIAKTAAGVTSIQAAFVQEKHLEILSRPLVSSGEFIFQKPASLRWEYTSPVGSLVLVHDGRTRRYVDRGGQMAAVSGMSDPVMPVVMAEITRWLGGRFLESNNFRAELAAGEKIILFPRSPSLSRVIQRVELVLHDTPGVIRSVKIMESETSFTTLEFIDPNLNTPVPEAVFLGL